MQESASKLIHKVQDYLATRSNLEECEHILDSLLADDVAKHEAFYLLGCVNSIKERWGLAKEYFLQAIAYKPDEPACINNLACAYQELNHREKAIALFKRLLEKEPEYGGVHTNLAVSHKELGLLGEALPYARKAFELEPESPYNQHNLGQVLLGLGNYKEGFEHYEGRLRQHDRTERFYTSDKTDLYWDGSGRGNKIKKTIVVHGEQGLGDEIMFASMLPDVIKDCNVIYDCNPRLINIMRNSFPDIPVYGTKTTPSPQLIWPGNYSNIDAKISIGSLAKYYRRKDKYFLKQPYLKADAEIVEKYRLKLAELGSKPKIGISWYGGAKITSMDARFNALANWKELLGFDCDFISLQYNPEAAEKIERFNSDSGTNIIHWPEMVSDYDETAGLLMNLDLVISAPQSVVHLAGALGVPCWRLCAKQALWTHGVYGKDAPWYGSVKNYWQETDKDWQGVMNKVCLDFKEFIKTQQRIAA